MLPSGYSIARPRREDAAAVARLVADFDTATFGSSDSDIEDLKAEWNAPGFSLDDDAWIVWAPSGEAAGYATAVWQDKGKDVWGDAFVHPHHAGGGIGSFLIDLMEERFAAQASDSKPIAPGDTIPSRFNQCGCSRIACRNCVVRDNRSTEVGGNPIGGLSGDRRVRGLEHSQALNWAGVAFIASDDSNAGECGSRVDKRLERLCDVVVGSSRGDEIDHRVRER